MCSRKNANYFRKIELRYEKELSARKMDKRCKKPNNYSQIIRKHAEFKIDPKS